MAKNKKLFDLTDRWGEYVDMKNPYQFGEELDMEDFQQLLKETYELICEVKGRIIAKQSDAEEIFDYASLISQMSHYIPDTCTSDESEDGLFSITCFLTEALVDFAINGYSFIIDDEIINVDGKDCPHKIVYETDYGDYLVYDIDTGDYSEFSGYVNGGIEDEFIDEP